MTHNNEVPPDDCPHPERAIQPTHDLTTGFRVYRCQNCGCPYHIIGPHERIEMSGECLETARYRCAACGFEADDVASVQAARCAV